MTGGFFARLAFLLAFAGCLASAVVARDWFWVGAWVLMVAAWLALIVVIWKEDHQPAVAYFWGGRCRVTVHPTFWDSTARCERRARLVAACLDAVYGQDRTDSAT